MSKPPWRALFFFTSNQNFPLFALGLTVSVLNGLLSPATSIVTGKLFNILTSYGGTHPLAESDFHHHEKIYITYLIVLAGLSWLLDAGVLASWLAFGELQAKSARDRLFLSLLEKNLEWYDRFENGFGTVMPRIQTQIRELQMASSQPLGEAVAASTSAVISLAVAFVYSWKLAIVTFDSVLFLMPIVFVVGGSIHASLDEQSEKLAAAQTISTTAIRAIETVKCFNGQDMEVKRYMHAIGEAARCHFSVAHANALQMALVVLLSLLMFVQGFYYGGVLIKKGELSVGDVITTLLSALGAFMSISSFLPQMVILEKGRSAGSSLREIIIAESHGRNAPYNRSRTRLTPSTCSGNVDITNLTFAYSRPSRPALRDLSLTIPGGRATFILGKSGSGKSTLGALLAALYNILPGGQVKLDGTPFESLDVDWLRSNITLVDQSSVLFNDTIFQNIAVGNVVKRKHSQHSVSSIETRVDQAVDFALLRRTLEDMPDGLDTMIERNGAASVSGGQRQRIALARARIRDSQVLILDEPTSALDDVTAETMMEKLRAWRKGRTTVVITHDFECLKPMDYVVVLDQGSVVNKGLWKDVKTDTSGQCLQWSGSKDETPIFETRGSYLDHSTEQFESLSSGLYRSDFLRPSTNGRTDLFSKSPLTRSWRLSPMAQFPPLLPSASLEKRGSMPAKAEWQSSDEISIKRSHLKGEQKEEWEEYLVNSKAADRYKHKEHLKDRPRGGTVESWSMAESAGGSFNPSSRSCAGDNHSGPRSSYQSSLSARDLAYRAKPLHASLRSILGSLWPMANRRLQLWLLCGFLAATIHALASPISSYVLAKLIKTYSSSISEKEMAPSYAVVLLIIAVVNAMATYTYRILFEIAGQQCVDNARSEAMRRILVQPLDFFAEEENGVAHLCDGLDRYAEEMRCLLGQLCVPVYIATVLATVSIVWSLATQWKLTVVALASVPCLYLATHAFMAISSKWENLSIDAAEETSTIFTETFVNIKTVRAWTLEMHFTTRLGEASNEALKIGLKRSLLSGFFGGLSSSAGQFTVALMFHAGANLALTGEASTDRIIQVFTQLIFAVTNVSVLLDDIPQISAAIDAASRLLRLAQLPLNSHETDGDVQISSVGDIHFDNLRFSYSSRTTRLVLKDLNLHIKSKTSTAIVGASGSGKSTIAKLLLKLHGVSDHCSQSNLISNPKLKLSNVPISRISTRSLRSAIAAVPQHPLLFPATVAENIAYGLSASSPFAARESVILAATKAGIHDFIVSLPDSYDTFIGLLDSSAGGAKLSHGQIQRIAIARALVRCPSVLIMDEPTNALDPSAAQAVRATVEALVRKGPDPEGEGMTVLVITHSRAMMECVGEVVVLENGGVVEHGKFEELISRKGMLMDLLGGGRGDCL